MTQRTLMHPHMSWSPLSDWCARCVRLTSSQLSYTLRLMKDSLLDFQDSDLRISTTITVLFTPRTSRSGLTRSACHSLPSLFPTTTYWRRPLSMRLLPPRSFNSRKRELSLKNVFTLIQERSSALRCFLRTPTLSKFLSKTWMPTRNSIWSISRNVLLTMTKSGTNNTMPSPRTSSKIFEGHLSPPLNELHY